jgi:hypothetical protein
VAYGARPESVLGLPALVSSTLTFSAEAGRTAELGLLPGRLEHSLKHRGPAGQAGCGAYANPWRVRLVWPMAVVSKATRA